MYCALFKQGLSASGASDWADNRLLRNHKKRLKNPAFQKFILPPCFSLIYQFGLTKPLISA